MSSDERKPGLVRTCKHCGKEFTVRAPSVKTLHCSRSCAARSSMTNGTTFQPGVRRATRKGQREDLNGRFFRSSWEANYARYLNHLQANGEIREWRYECQRFDFPYKRGNNSYMPDFRIVFPDGHHEWHEIKGWMDDASRVKLKRFGRFYPDEKLVLVDKKVYRELERKVSGLLPHWEN